jgi:NAD(P)-dependent dehydrogenase (short-subunit alcohol dehydrogenase family)
MADDFDLDGKVALVTGGSRGLGRQMALAFAKRGAKVAITSRKVEQCEATAKEIEDAGGEAFSFGCHVADWDRCGEMVEAVYERFGTIDVLVNNAGMSPLYDSLADVSEELFDKVIGVNLKGPFRLTALIGKRMAEGDGGSIINISSIASVQPSPNAEPYGAAKAGLNAITRSFAWEYGPKVRVNAILAGPFLTDISKAWDMEAFQKRADSTIPLQRGGQPEEIVGAALYFASSASSFTTGALLRVDGGSH